MAGMKNKFGGGGNKCFTCKKTVYVADKQVQVDSSYLHIQCFKCDFCKIQLNKHNYAIVDEPDDHGIYCKAHRLQRHRELHAEHEKNSPKKDEVAKGTEITIISDYFGLAHILR